MTDRPVNKVLQLYQSCENAMAATRARYADWPCGRGCSACCHQSTFPVTTAEAELLLAGVGRLPADEQARIKAAARRIVRTQYKGHRQVGWLQTIREHGADTVKCPLLDETGACLAYDYRPTTCRTFGYTCWNDERHQQTYGCSIINHYVAEQQIPQMVDMRPLQTEMKEVLWGESRTICGWLADDKCWKVSR